MERANSLKKTNIWWLTVAVAVLATFASAGGLLLKDLYRDSELIKTAWRGNDLVTLVAIPLLFLSVTLQKRGDQRGIIVWLGLMIYVCYNYAFYLFGAVFNKFFLAYVALFSLSLYSIFIGLLSVNAGAIRENTKFDRRTKWISVFLFFVALPLSVVEIGQCLEFIISGREPATPPLIFALDLSIVVPTTVLASVLLWKDKPWGNVLAMMMLIKSFTYGLVLVTGSLLISLSGIAPLDPLIPFYASLVAGGFLFGVLLFYILKPSNPVLTTTI